MYRFGKAALNLSSQAARQVRHSSSTVAPNFHHKYGTALIAGGAVFCVSVWGYVLTQTGMVYNFSPVGKIQPKPWRDAEAEAEAEE